MSGIDHKLDDLRRLDLLAQCTDEELRVVAGTADLVVVRSGEVLRQRGGADRSFFLIVSGIAALGTEALLTPGDSDGSIGLLGGDADTDELRMLSDGRVLVATPRQFSGLIDSVPGFARGIAEDLSRRLRARHLARFGEAIDRPE